MGPCIPCRRHWPAEQRLRVRGRGEPVVLVNAGVFADWFAPLLDQTALTARYRVVHYRPHHRVPVSLATHQGTGWH